MNTDAVTRNKKIVLLVVVNLITILIVMHYFGQVQDGQKVIVHNQCVSLASRNLECQELP